MFIKCLLRGGSADSIKVYQLVKYWMQTNRTALWYIVSNLFKLLIVFIFIEEYMSQI